MSYTITHARGGIPSHIDGNVYPRRSDLIASVAPAFGLDVNAAAFVHVAEIEGGNIIGEWYVYRSNEDAWNDSDGTAALFVIGRV